MPKKEIVLVDDESINLTLLMNLLKDDYRLRAFKSGEAFLRGMETGSRPDLVLLDSMMPAMDGYATLETFRKLPSNHDIPVIFITAKDQSTDEEMGFQLGAVDYITKPFAPSIVRERIRVHLELKDVRDFLKTQNEWLEAEVERRVRDIVVIQDATLSVVTQLVETRDSDTGNHTFRTRSYVEVLAKALAAKPELAPFLDEETVELIVKASPLHDIGKIGVPDAILLKPGKLTPEEFEIMKKHCEFGANAIKSAIESTKTMHPDTPMNAGSKTLRFLEVAQSIALNHHEKWDGTGYPNRLKGDDIPLPGRLMALADVFDALTSPRVYKAPWSLTQAHDYILSMSGTQFDPDVVSAFADEFGQFERIHASLGD
jgi:putative two-component system response regulator